MTRVALSFICTMVLAGCSDTPLPSEPDKGTSVADGAVADGPSSLRDGAVVPLQDGLSPDGASANNDVGGGSDASVDQISPDTSGDSGPCGGLCSAGQDCVNGVCKCISGGSCSGCCADEFTCIQTVTVEQCGANGSSCFACPAGRASNCLLTGTGYCSCFDGFGPARPECDVGEICVEDGAYHKCVLGS